jgi:hypothetical protein
MANEFFRVKRLRNKMGRNVWKSNYVQPGDFVVTRERYGGRIQIDVFTRRGIYGFRRKDLLKYLRPATERPVTGKFSYVIADSEKLGWRMNSIKEVLNIPAYVELDEKEYAETGTMLVHSKYGPISINDSSAMAKPTMDRYTRNYAYVTQLAEPTEVLESATN